MPIRPIDMQVLLPKSLKLDQAKPAVVNRLENAMTAVQNEQAVATELKKKQVATLEKANATMIKKKLEAEKDGQKKKKENPKDDPNKGKHLDLKV